MKTVRVTIKDKLAIVTMDNGKSNALNAAMITELAELMRNIAADTAIGGVLLTGKDHFFSAGLDLIELYAYNDEEAKDFWQLFLNFIQELIAFPKPLVAAINGHSPAGGCVLALACDARVMAEGKYIIGLNEVPVGIIVPNRIFQLYAFWLGEAKAARYLLEGKLMNPQEALDSALVDEVVNSESILTMAERRIRKYMAFEPVTWSKSKIHIRKALLKVDLEDQQKELDLMLQQWWSPSTRAILKSIIDGLQKKS